MQIPRRRRLTPLPPYARSTTDNSEWPRNDFKLQHIFGATLAPESAWYRELNCPERVSDFLHGESLHGRCSTFVYHFLLRSITEFLIFSPPHLGERERGGWVRSIEAAPRLPNPPRRRPLEPFTNLACPQLKY